MSPHLVAVAVAVRGIGLVSAETYCNESGSSANFTIQEVDTDSGMLYHLWSNNCPSHRFENNVPASFSSNCAVEQDYSYWVPATPVFRNESGNQNSSRLAAEYATDGRNYKPLWVQGRIGLNIGNSMLAYPGTGGDWDEGDAMLSEGTTLDYCGGHSNPVLTDDDGSYVSGGFYHIHGQEFCLDYNNTGFGHSPLIGWMIDGFPLYGLYSDDGERADDLDECNGHQSDSGANGGYHYHTTGFSGNMDGTYFPYPADSPAMSAYGYSKPYMAGCFRGCVPDQNNWADLQMESYADCVGNATAAPARQLTLNTSGGFKLADEYQINMAHWTFGAGSSCPNPSPTSQPTATYYPTTANCSAAPTNSINSCASTYGGECISEEWLCERNGGTFEQPACGSAQGSGCGCCYNVPSAAPTVTGVPSVAPSTLPPTDSHAPTILPTRSPTMAPSLSSPPTLAPSTLSPTLGPTQAYICSVMPSNSETSCEDDYGGVCVTDEDQCEDSGGTFYTPACGSAIDSGCGCCIKVPTVAPTSSTDDPTLTPTTTSPTTPLPTSIPTTHAPTISPTFTPTQSPTTPQPTFTPTTPAPTLSPTSDPTHAPTITEAPTSAPTSHPTHSPTTPKPSSPPSSVPTLVPTPIPSAASGSGGGGSDDDMAMIVVIVVVGVLACCAGCIAFFLLGKSKDDKDGTSKGKSNNQNRSFMARLGLGLGRRRQVGQDASYASVDPEKPNFEDPTGLGLVPSKPSGVGLGARDNEPGLGVAGEGKFASLQPIGKPDAIAITGQQTATL